MRHFDLAIIGSGSANSILDPRFAGRSVALFEKGIFGGTCLNVGCIPTKMFVHTADVADTPRHSSRLGVDLQAASVRWRDIRDRIFGRIDPISEGGKDYRQHHADNAHVELFSSQCRFVAERTIDTGSGETITADEVVLAAGSRPEVPEQLDGIDEVTYYTSDTVMRLEQLPEHFTIVGGGFIACEFAHVFASLGVSVTMLVRGQQLLRAEDRDVAERMTELARQKWDVRLGTNAKSVRQHGTGPETRLELELDDGSALASNALLIATGRRPNTDLVDAAAGGLAVHPDGRLAVDEFQHASVAGVWGLGDVSSPHQLKHVANHESRVVAHNLLHPDALVATDHRAVPHAVFSSPQIASVGLTEQEAERRGLRFVTKLQDYADIAYGWAMEDTTGFCKLIADPETGLLLGAHIIGPQAPTLIQPLVQAMSFGQSVRDLPRGQYWIHPAMPELLENAMLGLPLD